MPALSGCVRDCREEEAYDGGSFVATQLLDSRITASFMQTKCATVHPWTQVCWMPLIQMTRCFG